MSNQALFRQINRFYKLSSSQSDLLKELSELETFKDRIDFSEKHLEHLSSGSSRIIYVTPDKEVLKLAKNERGIAQNFAEGNPKMVSKFINKTLKADKNGYWKTSPYLEKITEKEFEKMMDFSFKDFGEALSYGLKEPDSAKKKKPDNFDTIAKSDLYKEIVRCGKEHHLLPGDLGRVSSWGRIDGYPILLDAGLTSAIYKKFYTSNETKSKS